MFPSAFSPGVTTGNGTGGLFVRLRDTIWEAASQLEFAAMFRYLPPRRTRPVVPVKHRQVPSMFMKRNVARRPKVVESPKSARRRRVRCACVCVRAVRSRVLSARHPQAKKGYPRK